MLLVRLLDQLIVGEQVLDRLFFPSEFILQDLNLGLKLYVVLFDLVVENFHLKGFVIKLFLFLCVHPVLIRFGLGWSSGVSQGGRETLAHHRVIRVRVIA
jgi:hypothetical protein